MPYIRSKAQQHWRDCVVALNNHENPTDAFRKKRRGNVEADDTVTAYVETFKTQHLSKLAEGTADYYTAELDRLADKLGSRDIRRLVPCDLRLLRDRRSR